MDSGSAFHPITLQFTHDMHMNNHCSLNELIAAWHEEQSMKTAMIGASPCLCLHIDRFFQGPTGCIVKRNCSVDLDTEVRMPAFNSTGLTCETNGYIPIAAVIHLGQDLAGHCRALLRMQPTVTQKGMAVTWQLTDDGVPPTPLWKVPDWCLQNLMVVWLIRTDCLLLPRYHEPQLNAAMPPNDNPVDSAVEPPETNALLHLLQLRPDMPQSNQ